MDEIDLYISNKGINIFKTNIDFLFNNLFTIF